MHQVSHETTLEMNTKLDIKKVVLLVFGVFFYFMLIALNGVTTAKNIAITCVVLAVIIVTHTWSTIRNRLSVPFMVLTFWVILNGISTFYAVSGKFALRSFLIMLTSYTVIIFALCLANGDKKTIGRGISTLISTTTAVIGFISIDFMSSRIISTPVLKFLGMFTRDYENIIPVETNIRMLSIFQTPNVFASCMGIGVFLSLGLIMSSKNIKERMYNVVCLFINALSFLLAFSMGGSGSIMIGFIIYLIFERKEKKARLIVLMIETFIFCVICTFEISSTSFDEWTKPIYIPIICLIVGAVLFVLTDFFIEIKLSDKINRFTRKIPVIIISIFVILFSFILVAMNLTGEINLKAGESIRRSAYPKAGTYTLSVESDQPVNVIIESQNKENTIMHTSTEIYNGVANGAEFTVPQDSLIIYATFKTNQDTVIKTAKFENSENSGKFPLKYKLLPEFIANRIQGLFANQNAIQRFVFFEDGMKMFKKSPIIGLGMGSYENMIISVQSFFYETKYAHNHYIQSLVEVGIIGLFAFVATLLTSFISIILCLKKAESETSPLVACLGGLLVFMAVHAFVEVIFSMYFYLPIAFLVFAIIFLCCGESISTKWFKEKFKNIVLSVITLAISIYGVFLACNMYAGYKVNKELQFSSLVSAAKLDKFEWADHMISYVYSAINYLDDEQIKKQADIYAKKLEKLNSNTIPLIIAEYYFSTDKKEEGFNMIKKYVKYTISNPKTWEEAFSVMFSYYSKTNDQFYIDKINELYKILNNWNSENIGKIVISEDMTKLLSQYNIA